MNHDLKIDARGIAGDLRLARAERMALTVASIACGTLSLPGMAVGLLGHAIGNVGGYSIGPKLSSGEPKQVAGALIGYVGLALSGPMLLRSFAESRIASLDKKMAALAESIQADALSLSKQGMFEELAELTTAVGGGQAPLGKPELGRMALALFQDAISRDDGPAVAQLMGLSGGKFRFKVNPSRFQPDDAFEFAAGKGAKACCDEFMRLGAKSHPGTTPWFAAQRAAHHSLSQKLSAYHSAQVEPLGMRILRTAVRKVF